MKKLVLLLILMLSASRCLLAQEATADLLEQTRKINNDAPRFKFIGGDVHDFKVVKEGDIVKYDFVFVNEGKDPLVIQSAAGTCGCTIPEWPKEPILGGKKGKIGVSFNSRGQQTGVFTKDIYIQSNAVTKAERYKLQIKGLIVAAGD